MVARRACSPLRFGLRPALLGSPTHRFRRAYQPFLPQVYGRIILPASQPGPQGSRTMTNRTIADMLFDYAGFLEARRASLYRIRAYRRAAETILALDRSVEKILEVNGRAGLAALPS